MAMKGKWAQGIKPRNFTWIIQGKLAACERPGGYGANHRRVRRQEEIIWIREQGFTYVISLSSAPHNLHNYDELGVNWLHRPFSSTDVARNFLATFYAEIDAMLNAGHRLVLHQEELSDRLAGVLAGYLVWAGMLPEPPEAITMIEKILERQLGPVGRELASVATQVPPSTS